MSDTIKIHVMHTGQVRVSPYLPYGGEDCNILKASGIMTPKKEWVWLPVSVYLVEHPKGLLLVDTGWHRDMSPDGVYDKQAQIRSLGSKLLCETNQGQIESGAAVHEQLLAMGIKDTDLDYVLLTHLDCDHANGLKQVMGAKNILVSQTEMEFAQKKTPVNRIRYQRKWWDGVNLTQFGWNDEEGPFGRAYDLFGDGSVKCINIPGHSDGQCAVKIRNKENRYVLLFADGGYSDRSWKEQILSGISADKEEQKTSLEWIRQQSIDKNCVEALANHDDGIQPHVITL